MQRLRQKLGVLLAGAVFFSVVCMPVLLSAQDGGNTYQIPEGVYIKLTKDFYEALKKGGSGGAKVYTNNPSDEYLKQIAVSAKFMVETNLEILKQQERMNQLLDSLLKGRKK